MIPPRLPVALGLVVAVFALAASLPAGLAAPGKEDKGKDPNKEKRDLAAEAELRKKTRKVQDRCGERLGPVIKFAVEKGLKEEAEQVLATLRKSAPEYKRLGDLEKAVEGCTAAAGEASTATARVKADFQKRLDTAYDGHGQGLMGLAKECFKYGMYARAFDLVNEVIDFDPDSREARRILGWVHPPGDSKRWVSRYELEVMKNGGGLKIDGKLTDKTPHVLYMNKDGKPEGWIPKKDVAQWDKGMRPLGGGWAPEAEETRKRKMNPYAAWSVESEHFVINTGISRAAAYEFGWELLEDYYTAFVRHYFGFFENDKGAELLFNVKEKNKAAKKHGVFLYPSRNDYLQHVKAEHGNTQLLIDSAGFYSGGSDHCSHFYATDDREQTLGVLYHEVAHQLFEETKQGGSRGGSQGNNWVPEGTASYMETWVKKDGRWIPGANKQHPWMMGVKKALENDQSFDLGRFIAIDYKEFHAENRGFNYAMSQSLSYFLMHYDDERYKEDFVQFIRAYYEGEVKPDSLPQYIQVEGESSPTKRLQVLSKQFKEFMAGL